MKRKENSIYTIPFSCLNKDNYKSLIFYEDIEEKIFLKQIQEKIPQEFFQKIEELENTKDIRKKNKLFKKLLKELQEIIL